MSTLTRDETRSAARLDPPPAAPLSAYADRGSRELGRVLWGLSGAVFAAIVVAAVTPIRHVTTAAGEVAPQVAVIDVAHPEGGAVVAVLARPGDVVKAGQPLLRLDPALAGSDLGQTQVRAEGLALAEERLAALLEDRAPQFERIGAADPQAAAQAMTAFRAEQAAAAGEQRDSTAIVAQRQAETETLRAEIGSLTRQADIQRERLAQRRDLLARGWIAPAGLAELELALARTEGDLDRAQGRLKEAEAALARAQTERARLIADRRRYWAAELAQVSLQRQALGRSAEGLQRRFVSLELRAPSDGIVQSIGAAGVGAVVRPGEAAVRLVPSGAALTAEVRVAPQDIAQVRPGDRAKVTITAFDAQLHEDIEGVVQRVSPTTFVTEDGRAYYIAVIELPGSVRTVEGLAAAVLPGMAVTVEIVGAGRPLLNRMLNPIDRAVRRSLTQWG